jgi:two-component system chemotaxis response regulator CheY
MIVWRAAAKAGFSPEGAATFEEAARLAREKVFDCITLDLSLGEHDGVEMLHHLHAFGCKAPIIIISGCDDATCRETLRVARSLDLNVCESVPKPVDLAMLRYALDRLRALRVLAFAEAPMAV